MTQSGQGAPKAKRPVAKICNLSRLLALIWAICIVGIVVISLVPKAAPSPSIDEYVHVSAFAFLAVLSMLAYSPNREHRVVAFVCCWRWASE